MQWDGRRTFSRTSWLDKRWLRLRLDRQVTIGGGCGRKWKEDYLRRRQCLTSMCTEAPILQVTGQCHTSSIKTQGQMRFWWWGGLNPVGQIFSQRIDAQYSGSLWSRTTLWAPALCSIRHIRISFYGVSKNIRHLAWTSRSSSRFRTLTKMPLQQRLRWERSIQGRTAIPSCLTLAYSIYAPTPRTAEWRTTMRTLSINTYGHGQEMFLSFEWGRPECGRPRIQRSDHLVHYLQRIRTPVLLLRRRLLRSQMEAIRRHLYILHPQNVDFPSCIISIDRILDKGRDFLAELWPWLTFPRVQICSYSFGQVWLMIIMNYMKSTTPITRTSTTFRQSRWWCSSVNRTMAHTDIYVAPSFTSGYGNTGKSKQSSWPDSRLHWEYLHGRDFYNNAQD